MRYVEIESVPGFCVSWLVNIHSVEIADFTSYKPFVVSSKCKCGIHDHLF